MSKAKITCLLSSLTLGALLIAATPVPVAPACAGNEVFLKVDGIEGESLVTGYRGWMQMEDFRLSIENGTKPGATSSTRVSVPLLSNLEVSAAMVPNLPELTAMCAMGTVVKSVTLEVRNLTSGINGPIIRLQLQDAVIAKVATEASADGDSRQVMEIAYSKITMTTRASDGRERTMTWNVATNSSK